MSAVSYRAILNALKDIFEADERTSETKVFVETDPQVGLQDSTTALLIMLNRRRPTQGQPIAAGKRVRYTLSFSVWVIALSLESFEKASELRDELLGNAELVMMANPKIGNTVESAYLQGGEFFNVKADDGINWCAMAEIAVEAQVSAINT